MQDQQVGFKWIIFVEKKLLLYIIMVQISLNNVQLKYNLKVKSSLLPELILFAYKFQSDILISKYIILEAKLWIIK